MAEARLRICLARGEVEIEGTEAFVAEYAELFDELALKLKDAPVSQVAVDLPPGSGAPLLTPGAGRANLEAFGEMLHSLPSNASGTDQILLAGYYAQRQSSDGAFATKDASSLLVEQGIKLSNPTQSLSNSLSAKRVFKVGKKWKVAKTGEDHLRALGLAI